jgi:ATP synthase protein I
VIGIAGEDARLLLRSAVPTAIAGAVALVIGALVAGGRGALGALLGVLVVGVFYVISMLVVGWVSRVKPAALMPTAVGTFLVKVLLLLGLIAALRGTTAFNTKVFGFTAIGCVLVWSAGQISALARKIPYVEPVASTPPGTAPAADEASEPATAPGQHKAGQDATQRPRQHSVNTGGDR